MQPSDSKPKGAESDAVYCCADQDGAMGEYLDATIQRVLEEAIRSGRVTSAFSTGAAAGGTVGSNANRLGIQPQDALMADEIGAQPGGRQQGR